MKMERPLWDWKAAMSRLVMRSTTRTARVTKVIWSCSSPRNLITYNRRIILKLTCIQCVFTYTWPKKLFLIINWLRMVWKGNHYCQGIPSGGLPSCHRRQELHLQHHSLPSGRGMRRVQWQTGVGRVPSEDLENANLIFLMHYPIFTLYNTLYC